MKKIFRVYGYVIVAFTLFLVFAAAITGYIITKNDLSKVLAGTPYQIYGADWPIIQKNLDLTSLAETGEIADSDLVKLTQEIRFNSIDTSKINAKCSGLGCINCKKGSGLPCLNVTYVKDESLSIGEVKIEEYTKIIYCYTDEITEEYFPKADIIMDNNQIYIQFNDVNESILADRQAAVIAKPKVMQMFGPSTVDWSLYRVQSLDKHFVVKYN